MLPRVVRSTIENKNNLHQNKHHTKQSKSCRGYFIPHFGTFFYLPENWTMVLYGRFYIEQCWTSQISVRCFGLAKAKIHTQWNNPISTKQNE